MTYLDDYMKWLEKHREKATAILSSCTICVTRRENFLKCLKKCCPITSVKMTRVGLMRSTTA